MKLLFIFTFFTIISLIKTASIDRKRFIKNFLIEKLSSDFGSAIESCIEYDANCSGLPLLSEELRKFVSSFEDFNEEDFSSQMINHYLFLIHNRSYLSGCHLYIDLGNLLERICSEAVGLSEKPEMASVTHHFKEPIMWALVTSRSLGHPEFFTTLPLLIDNIRKSFLNQAYTFSQISFSEKLKFIRTSIDFQVDQFQTECARTSKLYNQLKCQFLYYVDRVIADLCRNSSTSASIYPNLGMTSITFSELENFLLMVLSNDDMWRSCLPKIEELILEIYDLASFDFGLNMESIRNSISKYINNQTLFDYAFIDSLICQHICAPIREVFNAMIGNPEIYKDQISSVDSALAHFGTTRQAFLDHFEVIGCELQAKYLFKEYFNLNILTMNEYIYEISRKK